MRTRYQARCFVINAVMSWAVAGWTFVYMEYVMPGFAWFSEIYSPLQATLSMVVAAYAGMLIPAVISHWFGRRSIFENARNGLIWQGRLLGVVAGLLTGITLIDFW
ncbi:hypothetical protein WK92_15090 [Burkholderia ubonensis]|uniref:hypothetical protein n=1 Tax=Burkholderia ubonensis TaxID=101571 RepID=UPI00075C5A7E|nr:hypothetical protein [Burkholderia ubonensis]KVV48307.1 hypothetical protein WK82_14220 [Burkholderia ubonensis]KVW21754.1 hypothetical protein WK92_15090 [Burkholderia ubonensis]KVW47320.1 hypothetical protein WK95_06365 [Burkholderia ubonensis]